jgi:eukaryotic-like serine/threonine-protein kinase
MMKCPNCGTKNVVSEDFCENCGAYLHDQVVTDLSAPQRGAQYVTEGVASAKNPGSSLATNSTLTLNTRLESGRYVVTRVLGLGGMGAAVLARDTRVSDKLVVIKELISDEADPAQRQEHVRNFMGEVKTLAGLDHPLIPSVTDSFQEGMRYFMVQEYVAGENLEHYMERTKRPMPEREALTYASQVLDILQYLSQQQPPIVHRDIKPANIIIGSRDKLVHLVDFGIARAGEPKYARRKQTTALGTPGYAPPEQYQGNADARSDLYALAATLHFLLTNRDPSDYPLFNYPPIRAINTYVSPETERVLVRALMPNVNERYQSAAVMKQDIDAILAGRFRVARERDVYLRGTSDATSLVPPPQPERSLSSYGEGLRPQPGFPPRPPSVPRWHESPWVNPYQQAQQPQSQRQLWASPPQQRRPQQDERFIALSFGFLLIVVGLIALVLYLLPYLGGF